MRTPELSAALAARGIRHHFEIHTLQGLPGDYGLEALVEQHRRGVIDWLIPISRSAADTLSGAGADPARIHVAPSGVALTAFQAVADLQPDRLASPRMVYLGRISLDRGLDILSLSRLAAAGLGEVTLVGDADDPVPQIPGLTRRPAVPHREVAGLYADSDLVILPYQPDLGHADGISPMKLFEAMAAGRPVIASDIPPLREILSHGHNALLADPKDPAPPGSPQWRSCGTTRNWRCGSPVRHAGTPAPTAGPNGLRELPRRSVSGRWEATPHERVA
ncbi:MAG: glycosyltransferase family 4 protein [Candidatus Thiodiazotropha sp.]